MTQRLCNICTLNDPQSTTQATYDAKTSLGPWAYVCDSHLKTHGVDNPQLHTKLSEVL